MKFGGSSLATADRILAVAQIVRERLDRRPVVVVSALGGVTGLLEQSIRAALADDRESLERVLADVERRHRWALAGGVEDARRRHDLSLEIDGMFEDLRQRLRSIRILGERTGRGSDQLLAFGEALSSKLVAAIFRDQGLPATWVDAREVMITDAVHGAAEPDLAAVVKCAETGLAAMLGASEVPLIGGHVGATGDGETTTLGRGGSDTSATVLGFALDAEEVQIWTDVDGLMTADPRLVSSATTLVRVPYAEAAELAFYGARVLHPASIGPALRKGIPLRVLNSMRPDGPGTIVHGDFRANGERPLAAVASREDVALVRFGGGRIRSDRSLPLRALRELERAGLVPDTLVATETALTAVVRGEAETGRLAARLDGAAPFELLENRAIICVVGSGLAEDGGCREAVLAALSGFAPELIALGASGLSATAVLPRSRLAAAVRGLHGRFFEEAERA